MFSLEKFYDVIYKNLLDPADIGYFYFGDFGSVSAGDFTKGIPKFKNDSVTLFYDQEPIYSKDFTALTTSSENERICYFNQLVNDPQKLLLFANSEYSSEKDVLLKSTTLKDWYYFFHGFAALDWYRNFEYQPPNRNFTKVFITFNNLYTEKRSYRLGLVAQLLENNLDGYISLPVDPARIKKEIFSPNCLLSVDSKKLVLKNLMSSPKLIIDTDSPHGALSAEVELDTLAQGLFHLVTETVFYDSKLHLTEKVFKPIVARRPFFLVGAPGNLAYLKSYGFRTFNHWIDESYDTETDNDQRIAKIVREVTRLCQLSPAELEQIYREMQAVLDYNFEWFYGGFKQVIVNELVDNFAQHVSNTNINYNEVKYRLAR